MISLRSVGKSFGEARALHDVNLNVGDDETIVLIGPNGAGKTTLLRLVAGLIRPSEGDVEVGGVSPVKARARVGLIGHEPNLYPHLTVAENLSFFAQLYGVDEDLAFDTLRRLHADHKKESLFHTLSRGEAQKASIARALVQDPDVLLADEPFSSLDEESAALLPPLLKRSGRTLMVATHDPERVRPIAETLAFIENGGIVAVQRARP